jgi:hypothetical protein
MWHGRVSLLHVQHTRKSLKVEEQRAEYSASYGKSSEVAMAFLVSMREVLTFSHKDLCQILLSPVLYRQPWERT